MKEGRRKKRNEAKTFEYGAACLPVDAAASRVSHGLPAARGNGGRHGRLRHRVGYDDPDFIPLDKLMKKERGA